MEPHKGDAHKGDAHNADTHNADTRNIGDKRNILGEQNRGNDILGEHVGSPLQRVLQWFKTMSTNEYIRGVKNYNWQRFDRKLWQRNYWEHIIRNEKTYKRISEYIKNNPYNWDKDKFRGTADNIVRELSASYNDEIWMI